jgi:hypothetical protein
MLGLKNMVLDEAQTVELKANASEEYPIYRTPSEKKPDDEFTIKTGTVITAEFLGTKSMHSTERKENWEKTKVGNDTYYVNKHFLFQDADGKKFGLFRSGSLWQLEHLMTNASHPEIVNPVVRLAYVGLVTGAEELKKHGLVLKDGDNAHVFKIDTAKSARFEQFFKGCINMLNDPSPLKKENNGLEGIHQDIANYQALQSLRGKSLAEIDAERLIGSRREAVLEVGTEATAQLSM